MYFCYLKKYLYLPSFSLHCEFFLLKYALVPSIRLSIPLPVLFETSFPSFSWRLDTKPNGMIGRPYRYIQGVA